MTAKRKNKLTRKYVSLSAATPSEDFMTSQLPAGPVFTPQLSPDAQRIMDLTMELSSKVNSFQIDLGVATQALREEKTRIEEHLNNLRNYFEGEKQTMRERHTEELAQLNNVQTTTLNFASTMHAMVHTLYEKFTSQANAQEQTNAAVRD